ncbi:MAG: hypothetical protein P8M17_06680 [Saprospiraceae bacterium]|nr:hypothetical protein [Saprospiraceae bacterium]MDG1433155.1 hypothetical protein [Saprospiraceae bacterium]MDG2418659.1 hypothetical protein [Saprospiraceae bacterium]
MKHLLPISIIIVFLFSILPTGCVDDSTYQDITFKNSVDTLYRRGLKQFNKDLDSICTMQKDSLILSSMDSIKNIRLMEIEKLIRK